jgi:phosphatidylinositol alpha-1,6-mannosyltransferase
MPLPSSTSDFWGVSGGRIDPRAGRNDPVASDLTCNLMKILILSPVFPPATGGIERTAGALAAGLRDQRLDVVCGLPNVSVGMRAPVGVRVHWAANDPPLGRRATSALLRLGVRIGLDVRPDVVVALHIRTMPAARLLAHAVGSRSLLVIHAKEVQQQPALARASVRWADAIIAVSRFSKQLAVDAGADPERIRLVHPGVSLPRCVPLPLEERAGPPTIVTVARMSDRHKGHDLALAALDRLRQMLPDVRWIMIGDGELRKSLMEDAHRRGLNDHVTFTGAIDDTAIAQLLGKAHVFCMLNRSPGSGRAGEGFGIVFVEAGAHGLPVVAGHVPGVVDAVHDGQTGIVVEPTDAWAAAHAIYRVLSDPAFSQRLADGGRDRARSLAWPNVVDRYREVIQTTVTLPPVAAGYRGAGWMRDLFVGPRDT